MAIKEKDLQTIEQLSDGDKLRVVTSDGNSRNIPANTIGGGSVLIVSVTEDDVTWTLGKTYNEIKTALLEGKAIYMQRPDNDDYYYNLTVACYESDIYIVQFGDNVFRAASADVYPIARFD